MGDLRLDPEADEDVRGALSPRLPRRRLDVLRGGKGKGKGDGDGEGDGRRGIRGCGGGLRVVRGLQARRDVGPGRGRRATGALRGAVPGHDVRGGRLQGRPEGRPRGPRGRPGGVLPGDARGGPGGPPGRTAAEALAEALAAAAVAAELRDRLCPRRLARMQPDHGVAEARRRGRGPPRPQRRAAARLRDRGGCRASPRLRLHDRVGPLRGRRRPPRRAQHGQHLRRLQERRRRVRGQAARARRAGLVDPPGAGGEPRDQAAARGAAQPRVREDHVPSDPAEQEAVRRAALRGRPGRRAQAEVDGHRAQAPRLRPDRQAGK